MAVATYARFVTQSLGYGLTQHNAHIFHCVVIIDMGIALGLYVQIHQSVTCNLVQHMFEKGHAGTEFATTTAVQVQCDLNRGLQGIPFYLCSTPGHVCPSLHH